MANIDTREVIKAFDLMGIKPTLNTSAIKSSFRSAASKIHPDLFTDEIDKQNAHKKFVKLAAARDLLLEYVNSGSLLESLHEDAVNPTSNAEDMASYYAAKSGTAYDDEWSVFVTDSNAYFSFFDSASATITILFQALLVSVVVSLNTGILGLLSIPLFAIVIIFTVAFFSASISIPILGWIVGVLALGFIGGIMSAVWESVLNTVDNAAYKMLKTVARTGYPTRSFWFALFMSLLIVLFSASGSYYYQLYDLGNAVIIFFIFISGSMLWVWSRIAQKLTQLDEAFENIRSSSSYALVLSSKN